MQSVLFFKEGFELAPPVIDLNGPDAVILRFDDLDPDPQPLSYTLVHCDARWVPTELPTSQYIIGAVNDYIPSPRQSFNTLQPYLQYELRLPNDMMRPSRSGNYLLKVYRGNDPDDLVLTRRLLVFEQKVDIDCGVMSSRQVDLRDVAQQIDLTVRYAQLGVQDPFAEIHVAVLQNMRWDDLRQEFTPRFVRGNELVYDFPAKGLFMAGNEFRNFDLKNLRYANQGVQRIEPGPGEGVYHAHLLPEPRRSIRVYTQQPDINGRFLIRNDLFEGDPLGADYVFVHFTLPLPTPLSRDVHVYGSFTEWRLTPETRMTWDAGRSAYTAELLLKQGFYDFAYVTPLSPYSETPGSVDFTALEGSHYQTENDYLILVYFTDRMQRIDRLVGVRFLNSRRG